MCEIDYFSEMLNQVLYVPINSKTLESIENFDTNYKEFQFLNSRVEENFS